MERDFGHEIDSLKDELAEIKTLLSAFVQTPSSKSTKKQLKNISPMDNMHPDKRLSEKMSELCAIADGEGNTGAITYLGVYASGGRQSNWIRNEVNTDGLLSLIENRTAEKVLNCIGNGDRLNILRAILKKPMSVAEIVSECNFNSTGQAYHHMKSLLAADLIVEKNKGIYIVQPHKVQGIIMLLAGISDMIDETFTESTWE